MGAALTCSAWGAAWAQAVASPVATQAPIAYRCDRMQLTRAQHGGVCDGNVVLAQNDLLLCCERLTGQADANGQWQSFVCEGDVRGVQHDMWVWAGRARYDARREHLVLSERPIAARDGSVLHGTRITLHTKDDRLDVTRPRGRLVTRPPPAPAAPPRGDQQATLPDMCPIPAAPSPLNEPAAP